VKNKKSVVFGFLGTKLDAGLTDKRWERWRPSVALFAHEEFVPDQLELFISKQEHVALAQQVANDVATLREGVEVNAHLMDIADPWNFQQVYAALHEFAKAYEFQEDTDYFVHLTTGTHVAQICLFLLLEARYFPARIVETYSHGALRAEDAWKGSLEVIDLNLATYDQLAQRFKKESLDSQDLLKGGIATRNPAFNALIQRVEKVALRSTAAMLFTGPTGAGKSQLAARVYDLRAKRHLVQGAFVEVNCATLRGDNAMSTLFGHKRGAFTGAVAERAGLLKLADKGMLFLDEIGELGLDEQAMLLRALEDKRFMPLGSDKEVTSQFQLLAGTNKDLRLEVSEGRFRADLLARINVWSFELPGLAQRREDIEPNLDFEMERCSLELGTRVSMSQEARKAFLQHALTAPWPGNFRDFAACIMRMATLAEGGRITPEDVQLELDSLPAPQLQTGMASTGSRAALVLTPEQMAQLDEFDRVQLECVLAAIAETDSMAEAGRRLFAASRSQKDNPNDSDRVRKFLFKWGLSYKALKRQLA